MGVRFGQDSFDGADEAPVDVVVRHAPAAAPPPASVAVAPEAAAAAGTAEEPAQAAQPAEGGDPFAGLGNPVGAGVRESAAPAQPSRPDLVGGDVSNQLRAAGVRGRPLSAPRTAGEVADEAAVNEPDVDPGASGGGGESEGSEPPTPDAVDPDAPVEIMPFPVYKGLENSHEVFKSLLKSGLPEADVSTILADYNDYMKGPQRARRIADIGRKAKKIAEREAALSAREGAAAATGRGGLGSMLGGMLGNPEVRKARKLAAEKSAIEAQKEDLARKGANLDNDFAETQRPRMLAAKRKAYAQHMLAIGNEGEALTRAVRLYNDAFLDCEASSALRAAVEESCPATAELRAARAELRAAAVAGGAETAEKRAAVQALAAVQADEVQQVMQDLAEGKASAELAAKFDAAKAGAMADPDVVAAYADVEARRAEVEKLYRETVAKADDMKRAFPNDFDVEKCEEQIQESIRKMSDGMPKPVAEPEGIPQLKEKMEELSKEMAEKFRLMFKKISEAIQAMFGR